MGYQRRYDNRPRGNPETDEGRDQRSGLIILQKSKDLMKYLYNSWVMSFSIPDIHYHGAEKVFQENYATGRRCPAGIVAAFQRSFL